MLRAVDLRAGRVECHTTLREPGRRLNVADRRRARPARGRAVSVRLVPTLWIEHGSGSLRFRLDVPEHDQHEPLQRQFRQVLDDATLGGLVRACDELLRSAESARFEAEAKSRGQLLYRTLIPPDLRAPLRTVQGPLLVSTALYGLPWELVHDGEEFFGLRYAIGKRLLLDRPLLAPVRSTANARPRALVIGADPRGDLPFVRGEVDAICKALEPHADVDCVSGRLATFDAVVEHLATEVDIVHFCGHVVDDPNAGPSLLLADERPLPAPVIEANLHGRPLVFLNGCASARGGERGEGEGSWEATVSSVAHGFLFGGALAAVGTLADVSDRHASALAAAFYREALARVPVGEALRRARVAVRAAPSGAGSPTWLSFALYGTPSRVIGGAEPAEERTPVVLPAAPPVVPVAPALPAPVAAPHPRVWRRPMAWVGVALLAVLAVVGGWYVSQLRPAGPVTVGVMEVQARGSRVPDWMRELTRDSLNTILSKLGDIRVFSRQKIDFVRDKRGLTEIEAAEALGMEKMLATSVTVKGSEVTLDLDIIDIDSGMLDASERVQGPVDDLMSLQTDLALSAARLLGAEPSEEQVRAIVASRGNDTLDSYRLLTDTLGGEGGGEGEPPTPSGDDSSWLPGATDAYAQEVDPEERAIHGLLQRYETALESESVDQLATLQTEMTPKQRESLERYFTHADDLAVTIVDVDVLIEGDEAVVTFTRQDAFVDARSHRRMNLEVRISGLLEKQEGAWKIRGLRNPS
jgi:CHAT domain-containing protein/TolB-like protein